MQKQYASLYEVHTEGQRCVNCFFYFVFHLVFFILLVKMSEISLHVVGNYE